MLTDSPRKQAYRARVVDRRRQKFKALLAQCEEALERLKLHGAVTKTSLARELKVMPKDVAEVLRRFPAFNKKLLAHAQSLEAVHEHDAPSTQPNDHDLLLERLRSVRGKQPA